MSQNNSPQDESGVQSASNVQRRRLESEVFMYQSDRTKLLHAKDEAEVAWRTLKKEIDAKEALLINKKEEVERLVRKIQDVDGELLRLRKRVNSL